MNIHGQISEIYRLTADMIKAIGDEDWDNASAVVRMRDDLLHHLFQHNERFSDDETTEIRDMILKLQVEDKVFIDRIVIQRDKLVTDILEATAGQRALEAYAKNA